MIEAAGHDKSNRVLIETKTALYLPVGRGNWKFLFLAGKFKILKKNIYSTNNGLKLMLAWHAFFAFITRVDFCREHCFFKKMTKIFVAFFQKNQNFEKNKISKSHIFRLPKQSTFIHSPSIYPISWTKTELIGDFYQKTWFLPFLPPISLYKSTHNKILAKRGKSVSLEFPYGAACKKLGNSDLQFSRTRLFLHEKTKR